MEVFVLNREAIGIKATQMYHDYVISLRNFPPLVYIIYVCIFYFAV
jgi:hypothetical protein